MPNPASEDGAAPVLLEMTFGLKQIDQVRHAVERLSREHGLTDSDLVDWVLAVNELATNAVRHGSAVAGLVLTHGSSLNCRISDRGPGFEPSRYLGRPERPPLSAAGGMGLWLVERTTIGLSIDSGPDGTTVHITARGQHGRRPGSVCP